MRYWFGSVRSLAATLIAAVAALGNAAAHAATGELDVLIAGGELIDGTGTPSRRADVGVTGERITFVGDAARAGVKAKRTIDAAGRLVVPGFIDPHTHSGDDLLASEDERRAALNHIMQGVTTVFIGNDGGGSSDIARTLEQLRTARIGVNVATFIGLGPVRRAVIGEADRAPTAAELAEMRSLVAKGMCAGALGFSAGLYYVPQSFAKTDEVVALASEAAQRGGIYETHLREEGSGGLGLIGAIDEAIAVGRQAGLPVHIAHLKALGADVHGQASEIVARIEAARRAGTRVTADQYPWSASGTRLTSALVPHWAMNGGRAALRARLDDSSVRARVVADMTENLRRRGGADAVLVTAGTHKGRRLAAIASQWKLPPVEAALRVIREEGDAPIASFNMAARDIEVFAKQPWVVASSDASNGHPRKYGSFAERWHRFVRVDRILTPSQFVHRASGLTAQIFGLNDRGTIQVGSFADVAVLDPHRYASTATYESPTELAAGVEAVLVNGRLAVERAQPMHALMGSVIAKPRAAGWSCPD